MALQPGTRLGQYEILSALGAGGMGEVYRAHDSKLGRDVAIKVLPASSVGDQTARARLIREARTAAKLNHPHICTIHDVGEAEGHVFVAMELVDGESLAARLKRGPLPVDDVLRYGAQVADGLAHAHERGIVHRDLKSANIVLTPEGRAKILDFGLAKRQHAAASGETTIATVTERGTLAGTIAYMAPEQLRGVDADARSDIWALGVVLYGMTAGVRPFQGHTDFALSAAILNQPVPPLGPAVPTELGALIGRCLEKDPEQRLQRSADVQAALQAIGTGTTAPGPSRRRSSPRWYIAAGVAVAIGATLVGFNVAGLRDRLRERTVTPARAIRLAVLPFENLTGDSEQEYFSDGLTDELIAQLGRLHPGQLAVIARTSVMSFKKTGKAVDQIGRELRVDYVLEGSARLEAGRAHIVAELVRVSDQTQLWSDTYDRDLSGILAVQSEVSKQVARSMALTLLPDEQARLASAPSVNPEAYDAYLKGLEHWYRLTPPDLDVAQRYFELALQKDPAYAVAHAGIAALWVGRATMGFVSPREAGSKAKAAAARALAIDDRNAEAHLWLGVLKYYYGGWDVAGADAEFRRAIELNPTLPDARAMYSHFLCTLKRPADARAQIERAVDGDPLNAMLHAFYGVVLQYTKENDQALLQFRIALATSPDLPFAHQSLWEVLHATGHDEESLPELKKWAPGPDPVFDEALARGMREGGYGLAMRLGADRLVERARTEFVQPTLIAEMYTFAGDNDRAFEWLDKGLALPDVILPYVQWPAWDNLRGDARFPAFLRRLHLPL
jgi:TolB-like protein